MSIPNANQLTLKYIMIGLISEDLFWNFCRWVQKGFVQAQYWHDPRYLDQYKEHSLFLADINNERVPRNSSYALNLAQLEKFVLVRFNNDTMVEPVASEWFEFYAPGQAIDIQPLEESAIYKEVFSWFISHECLVHFVFCRFDIEAVFYSCRTGLV